MLVKFALFLVCRIFDDQCRPVRPVAYWGVASLPLRQQHKLSNKINRSLIVIGFSPPDWYTRVVHMTLAMTRPWSHVRLVVRGPSLAASMSNYLSSRLEADPAISIEYNSEIVALHGSEKLHSATVRDTREGTNRDITACAVFVMIGAKPNTAWLSDMVELDKNGFVLTGAEAGADSPYATSRPGIFAVGDVRAGSVKRVASSVGEGSLVISKVWQHLKS